MPSDTSEALAKRYKISRERVSSICELLDRGYSSVYIAHYRKAETGGMDEATLQHLVEARRELVNLDDLRRRARAAAEQAGALTDDLALRIDRADGAAALQDLLLPVRPRRRTAAGVARERGLEPLADYSWAGPADGPDLREKAAEFVRPDHEVRSPEEALTGAGHILAERVADDPSVRRAARQTFWEKGVLKAAQAPKRTKGANEFRSYFNFREPLSHIPPHRVLAVNRGERSKALKVTVDLPENALQERVLPLVIPEGHRFAAYLKEVVTDALERLVLPQVQREVRRGLTTRAERHAIEVFQENLRSLLMALPVRGRCVLAIQPGYRTGCKTAALAPDGALLGETICYPLEPQKKWAEAKAAIMAEIQRHGIDAVAIGNGTGCREVEALVSELIEEQALDLQYTIVCEAGAAAYADSDRAKQEFPRLDAAIRAAVSIGRRLQDPLAELVKIDPRAIGVGLYQHDVDQNRLQRALDEMMESCVAAVGADANTASSAMLRRVPGLGDREVYALVTRRREIPFTSREELKTIPGWDEKTFQEAAAFLRISGDNPLDATRIHPDSYAEALRVLEHVGHGLDDLRTPEGTDGLQQSLTGLSLEPVADELQMPLQKLMDIVGALQSPAYDPREAHHGPIFRKRMQQIEDFKPGMWVKGTVRNVVDFGAFVDIGLKEEGLIHISQFSRRYVRNPLKFLHVGDVVDVRVVTLDAEKHRIALTLIPDKRKREPRPAARRPGPAPAGETVATGRPTEQRRGPRDGAPQARRPSAAPAGRGPGRDTSSSPSDRRRGPRPGRPTRDRRGGTRDGRPRVIISKAKGPTEERTPDSQGRPKIRWAYYDSDPPEDLWEDEEELVEEEPVAEPPADEPPAEERPPEAPPAEESDRSGTPPVPKPSEAEVPAPSEPAPAGADADKPPPEPPAETETPPKKTD